MHVETVHRQALVESKVLIRKQMIGKRMNFIEDRLNLWSNPNCSFVKIRLTFHYRGVLLFLCFVTRTGIDGPTIDHVLLFAWRPFWLSGQPAAGFGSSLSSTRAGSDTQKMK